MKLSRRIRDLLRANISAALHRPLVWGTAKSPRQLDAQLERIGTSLIKATAREKRVQDELAISEREGREQDAIRLRRDLTELNQSMDELQAALDLIEARVEMARQGGSPEATTGAAAGEAARPGTPSRVSISTETDSGEESQSAAQDDDLEDRKGRLAAPG